MVTLNALSSIVASYRAVGSNKKSGWGGGIATDAQCSRLGVKGPAACSSSRGVWGHAPPENFEILGITRCFLRQFGD